MATALAGDATALTTTTRWRFPWLRRLDATTARCKRGDTGPDRGARRRHAEDAGHPRARSGPPHRLGRCAQPDGAITSGVAEFRPDRWQGGGMKFLRFRRWLHRARRPTQAGSMPCSTSRCAATRASTASHAYGGWLAHPHRLVRAPRHSVPGRAGRHHQAAHRRQGQRRQAGGDRCRPPARLRAGRRQRGGRAGAAELGDRAGGRRRAMNAATEGASRKARRLGCRPRSSGR